jgi:hypothetical protein
MALRRARVALDRSENQPWAVKTSKAEAKSDLPWFMGTDLHQFTTFDPII